MTNIRSIFEALSETAATYCRWGRIELGRFRRKLLPPATRQLLLMCSYIPPTNTVGSLRAMSFARYAAANGWSVRIAGPRTPVPAGEILPFGPDLLPPEAAVTEVPVEPYRGSWRLTPALDGALIQAIWLAAACISTVNRPAVVLATGPRFNMFVAGLFVTNAFKIPLVLDYRDEWTTGSLSFVEKGWWNEYFERRCLKAASAVLFTTESFLKKAREKWPAIAGPHWHVLPNGFEPEAAPAGHCVLQKGATGLFTFIFLGNLADFLAPERFIEVVEQAASLDAAVMGRVRFRFVGRKSEAVMRRIEASRCKNLFELIPSISQTEVWREYAAAAGLLLVYGPGCERYRPTKLYEYMGDRKPILYFGPSGEVSTILENIASGVVVTDGDPHTLLRAIRSCLDNPEGFWDTAERRVWAAQYTRESIAKQLFEILDGLAA